MQPGFSRIIYVSRNFLRIHTRVAQVFVLNIARMNFDAPATFLVTSLLPLGRAARSSHISLNNNVYRRHRERDRRLFSAIATVLALVPIPFQLQSWNTGIVSYASWCAALCFFHLLNSIIWHDNVNDVAPELCDISTYRRTNFGNSLITAQALTFISL